MTLSFPSIETTGISGRLVDLAPLDLEQHGDALWPAVGAVKALWTYIPGGPFNTRKTFEDWLSERQFRPGYDIFTVLLRSSGAAAGILVAPTADPEMGVAEIGLILGPELAGAAGGTEAVYLLCEHILGACGYRRLEWRTDPANAASCRAAERYGFRFEGCLRQTLWLKDRNWDTNIYSILDHEWPQVRARFISWLAPANFHSDGRQRRSLRDLMQDL